MRQTFFYLAISLLLFSCGNIKQEATTIEIEGKASGKIKAPIVQIN